jgi:hypothetical protein
MEVYLGKDRKRATPDMTATNATVKQLSRNVKGCGHKLYIDNNYSSPDLYSDLTKERINYCGTFRPNREGMPNDFRSKTLKQKWSDTGVRISGDMTAVVWKEKRDVHTLTNIRDPPEEGNFCVESRNTLKPANVEDYIGYVGYVDKIDRIANSCPVSHCTWK